MNNVNKEAICWQCSFDLRMDKLDSIYKKSRSSAYKEINKFLFKEGFDNIDEKQGSCYFTSEKIYYTDVDRIIRKAFKEMPWLPECVSRISVSERRTDEYNYLRIAQRVNKSKKHKEALEKYHKSLKPKAKSR